MKYSRLLIAIMVPVILLALFITSLQTKASPSATFTVNSTIDAVDVNPGDGVCETAVGNGVCTLRAAVMEANAFPGEDTIHLPAGNYLITLLGEDENSSRTGDLDITEDLSIIGADQTTTIIDGNQADRIFHILGVTTFISNLTITNGKVSSADHGGGGILNDRDADYFPGNLTLDAVNVTNNQSTGSGSGWNYSGGGILSRGPLTVTNSLIQSNETSYGHGGGIRAESTAYIENSTVSNNVASVYGGGIAASFITLVDSVIDNNTLKEGGYSSNGGGLYITYPSTIEGSTISNNSLIDGKGGGIYVGANVTLTISLTKIFSNSVNTPNGNTGTRGGGLYSESNQTVTIIDTTITGNTSDYNGGGIYNDPSVGSGKMNLSRASVNQNRASSQGAGIYNAGIISLSNVTIAENLATGAFNQEGGGIYQNGMPLTLVNSTVFGNEALYGGGIYQNSGSIILENTILANNTASGLTSPGDPNTHNCAGTISSAGHNLEDGNDCSFSSTGDLLNLNPLLLPTTTADGVVIYRPTSKSPVIDAGSDANCPGNDQRLVTRPIDGDNNGSAVCDIGSVEYDPSQDVFFSIHLPAILK